MNPNPISHSLSKFVVLGLPLGLLLAAQTVMPATFIQNPSFELNYNDVWPHYGPIDLWSAQGGTGINDDSGPFHNTPSEIPDRSRVAFLQGGCTVSQTLTGLTPGQRYCLQFFYDARNCCGGTVDLTVRVDAEQVDKITNIRPTPTVANRITFYSRSVPVTPAADTALLEFVSAAAGDATAILDGVSIFPCAEDSVPVRNASFEASGDLPEPYLLLPGENLGGWTLGGLMTVGVAASGLGAADNGLPPDQDHVAFLVGESSISQVLDGLEVGDDYEVSFAYNQPTGNSAHLRVSVGAAVIFDADVGPAVGGSEPYRTFTNKFQATEISASLLIEQTAPGQTVLLDTIGVRGTTRPPLPCLEISPSAAELAPTQSAQVAVIVPSELTASQAATIVLRSPNLGVLELVGADIDGTLAVPFGVGETRKNIEVLAVARGVVRVIIVESAGLCTENDLSVTVLSSFVRNASFESSAVPAAPGYGAIVAWSATGQTGLNADAGPFHDNGTIPDRRQVAFIQGSGSLAQDIVGLTPGTDYWLQFHYNARNCCGGSIDLQAKFGGTVIANITGVAPVGAGTYLFHNASFVPTAASGRLEFVTTAAGDASVLLDGVSIVQRTPSDVIVQNPSFESTGVPSGVGYIQPSPFAGWTTSGNYGPNIDAVGPFTDNGDAPDQDIVAFVQGAGSLSQIISGLTAGQTYTLSYAVNARNCCAAPGTPTHYTVTFDGAELINEDVVAVGTGNPYVFKSIEFTPGFAEGELRFSHQPPDGDRTLLLDNVQICSGNCRPAPRVEIGYDAVNQTVRVAWDGSYVGYRLQFTGSLTGPNWQDVPFPVQVEGNQLVVLDDVTGVTRRFYRLTQ